MSTSPTIELIQRIHNAPHRGVIAVTGGGSRAVSDLLAVGGASRTVLEAIVPYSSAALIDYLGRAPEQFCSSHTARQMAMSAYRRAEKLRDSQRQAGDASAVWPVVGLGCTASLASDRPKQGPHRVHLAAQTATATRSWSLELQKNVRSRDQEESVVAAVLLDLLADVCELGDRPLPPTLSGEMIVRRRTDAPQEWCDLLAGECARTDVRPHYTSTHERPQAVLCGAFNPLHDGHRRMAALASDLLGVPVDYELSIENVEKPPLDFEEMAIRADQFRSGVRLWFTRAPRMKQKAALFPGATIVCGIDTLLRVADPQFAAGSEAQRDRDLAEIAGHGCRFLVFGRQTPRGFETLETVTIPDALRRLSTGVPESEFRADVSSTDIRKGS
jgi:hypothetical protein